MKRALETLLTAAAIAGCGVTTSQQAFTPHLIKQVGAGSVAEAQFLPLLKSTLNSPALFSTSQTKRATIYLFDGRLDKLTASDLQAIARAAQTASGEAGRVVAKLEHLRDQLAASTVTTNTAGLPSDSKTFVVKWNGYLTATSRSLSATADALRSMGPVYAEFPALIQAAYNTAKLRSTMQFNKLRDSVVSSLRTRAAPIQNATQSNGGIATAERRLVAFVNGSPEAQAVIRRVNRDYPNGFLAQEFKPSGA